MKKKHSIFIRTLAGCVKDLASLVETRDSSEILNAASTFIMHLLGDRLSKDFLYFALPVWSFVNNNWRSAYPVWCRDGRNEKRYQKLKKIFQYDLDFSFTGFMAHKIKRIPRILNIQFEWDATERSRIYCAKSTVNPMEVVMSVPIRNNVLNSAFLTGTGVAFDAEAKKFSQITQDDSLGGFLKVKNIDKLELEKFFRFLYCYARIYGRAIRSLFLISSNVYGAEDGDVGYGGLIIASSQKEPFKDSMDLTVSLAITINTVYSTIAISDWADFSNYRDRRNSTKSAIGSIMSRNGSHNIGSHVLAALSHNIRTMPDDRVLYQYIQHRMDYIATVTTEAPSWAASTKFVGEMMRTFLSQRHLLEYIASSEGLHAYRFQDPNIDIAKQAHTIQIHVRYGKHAGGKISFDDLFFNVKNKTTDRKQDNSQNEVKDVSLAIPGGVVGQHAFFTIIENVIRNAAKHGWSSKSEEDRNGKNLEIYIDVTDDSGKDYVTFQIWDNMSGVKTSKTVDSHITAINNAVFPSTKTVKNPDRLSDDTSLPLTSSQTKKLVERFIEETGSNFDEKKRLLDGDKIPLHWRQQILMDQKIIKEDGSLRRENWGMAEMKISAGYLQRRTVGQIGGLDELEDPDDYIVRAIAVPQDGNHRLGYEFKVPRPKKILIVLKDDTLPKNADALKKVGIYFLGISEAKAVMASWDENKKTDKFAAEYLVVQSLKNLFAPEKGQFGAGSIVQRFSDVPFPFRVLRCDEFPSCGKKSKFKHAVEKLTKMIPMVPDCWDNWNSDQIINNVLKTWREHCLNCRKVESDVVPFVNTKGESGAGQALISNADIWKLLFTEQFHSTLASFCKNEKVEKDLNLFILWLLNHRSACEFESYDGIESGFADQIVARQFKSLLDRVPTEVEGQAFDRSQLAREFEQMTKKVEGPEILRYTYNKYREDSRSDIQRLMKHFGHAFAQLDVMLRKYEERIVTLPNAYSPQKDKRQDSDLPKGTNDVCSSWHDESGGSEIRYDRHHPVDDGDYLKIYVEPLSGSQSYLNDLVAYQSDYQAVKGELTKLTAENRYLNARLIENGVMRILFVDERISRFLRGHEKSRRYYRAMNMWCVDETSLMSVVDKKDGGKKNVADSPLESNGKLLTFAADDNNTFDQFLSALKEWQGDAHRFDILVIHQGILDKWCKGQYTANSTDGMRKIIEVLKSLVNYVVITTGRGTPANIPPCARILPFSTIEGTLFKLYPEKLTLVNSIMNILPLGGNRNG